MAPSVVPHMTGFWVAVVALATLAALYLHPRTRSHVRARRRALLAALPVILVVGWFGNGRFTIASRQIVDPSRLPRDARHADVQAALEVALSEEYLRYRAERVSVPAPPPRELRDRVACETITHAELLRRGGHVSPDPGPDFLVHQCGYRELVPWALLEHGEAARHARLEWVQRMLSEDLPELVTLEVLRRTDGVEGHAVVALFDSPLHYPANAEWVVRELRRIRRSRSPELQAAIDRTLAVLEPRRAEEARLRRQTVVTLATP